jgi:rhodanese-related sulfurtransferase
MKQTTKVILLFTVLTVIGIGAYLYNMSVNSPYRISSEEAKKRIAAHEIDLVLDVRTEKERETLGSYPKSIWIPAANLEKDLPPRFPDRHMRTLIYCNTGHRARLATDKLRAMGYSQVFYISSGWKSLV